MTSLEIIPSASSAVVASSSPLVIRIDNTLLAFIQDNITDDLMIYTDNQVLEYEPLLFPTPTKVIKILGGKITISEDCFIENTDQIECAVCYDVKDILFRGLCPCNLLECKECFLHRMRSQFSNNYNSSRCLSNNHIGNKYCKTIKETETKTETITPITSSQIIKYRKEKAYMEWFKEFTFDVYELNVKGKEFNDLPLCFKIFHQLCNLVEDQILVGYERDETIDYKKQYYFYLDDDVKEPIRWGLNGYDWDQNDIWFYAHTSFYVMYRDKGHKRFVKTRISFDENEQLMDTLETHIIDQPLYYGREYCFDMLADNFQNALGNDSDGDLFRQLTENDDFENLIQEMVCNKKVVKVCKEILDNGDVNICDLMGCGSMTYARMDGDDDRDYTVLFYEEGVELSRQS